MNDDTICAMYNDNKDLRAAVSPSPGSHCDDVFQHFDDAVHRARSPVFNL